MSKLKILIPLFVFYINCMAYANNIQFPNNGTCGNGTYNNDSCCTSYEDGVMGCSNCTGYPTTSDLVCRSQAGNSYFVRMCGSDTTCYITMCVSNAHMYPSEPGTCMCDATFYRDDQECKLCSSLSGGYNKSNTGDTDSSARCYKDCLDIQVPNGTKKDTDQRAYNTGVSPTNNCEYTTICDDPANYHPAADGNSCVSNKIPVNYDCNGGTGTLANPYYTTWNGTVYTHITLPANTCSNSPKVFDQWCQNQSGTGTCYNGGATTNDFTTNTYLYAKWKCNSTLPTGASAVDPSTCYVNSCLAGYYLTGAGTANASCNNKCEKGYWCSGGTETHTACPRATTTVCDNTTQCLTANGNTGTGAKIKGACALVGGSKICEAGNQSKCYTFPSTTTAIHWAGQSSASESVSATQQNQG